METARESLSLSSTTLQKVGPFFILVVVVDLRDSSYLSQPHGTANRAEPYMETARESLSLSSTTFEKVGHFSTLVVVEFEKLINSFAAPWYC